MQAVDFQPEKLFLKNLRRIRQPLSTLLGRVGGYALSAPQEESPGTKREKTTDAQNPPLPA